MADLSNILKEQVVTARMQPGGINSAPEPSRGSRLLSNVGKGLVGLMGPGREDIARRENIEADTAVREAQAAAINREVQAEQVAQQQAQERQAAFTNYQTQLQSNDPDQYLAGARGMAQDFPELVKERREAMGIDENASERMSFVSARISGAESDAELQQIIAEEGGRAARDGLAGAAVQIEGLSDDSPEEIRKLAGVWGELNGGDDGGRRVQSTFPGADGTRQIVFTDGTVESSGVDERGFALRTIDTEAGTEAFDPLSGESTGLVSDSATAAGITTREANEAGAIAASRAAAETAAIAPQAREELFATRREELPAKIFAIEQSLGEQRNMLQRMRRGDFDTGKMVGAFGSMTTAGNEFEAFANQQVIEGINEATFGGLSEGERAFIMRSKPNRSFTEEANQNIMERRIEFLERQKGFDQAQLEEARSGQVATPSVTQEGQPGGAEFDAAAATAPAYTEDMQIAVHPETGETWYEYAPGEWAPQ